jgi:GNAT superfamily N-acetyltransferase
MTLRIEPVSDGTAETWREVHNLLIPASPLTADEVRERRNRHELTLAYVDGALVGNATLRPPRDDAKLPATATVIVRVLPPYRRRGLGTAYLDAVVGRARTLGVSRIETHVLAANEEGAAFALARGFAEVERYDVDGAGYVLLARDLGRGRG